MLDLGIGMPLDRGVNLPRRTRWHRTSGVRENGYAVLYETAFTHLSFELNGAELKIYGKIVVRKLRQWFRWSLPLIPASRQFIGVWQIETYSRYTNLLNQNTDREELLINAALKERLFLARRPLFRAIYPALEELRAIHLRWKQELSSGLRRELENVA